MQNSMRPRRVHSAVLFSVLSTLVMGALSGCMAAPDSAPVTSAAPVAEATATPTDTPPVFASNDEALAAAEDAYSEYQVMSNKIAHEGGAEAQRISEYTVGEVLESELATYERMSTDKIHLVGDLAFDSFTLQSADLSSGDVIAYVCLDVAQTDVIDAAGASVIPAGRPDRYPLQVSLLHDSSANRLFVEKSDSWSGSNFC